MQLTITARHIDIGEALQTYMREHFETVVSRYFGKAVDGSVTVSKEGYLIHMDISAHPGRGLLIQAKGNDTDPYAAFDATLDKLNLRMRKYKARLRDHHKIPRNEDILQGFQYIIPEQEDREHETTQDVPVIIAEIETQIPTLSVSEALMQLDFSDHPALLFKNKSSGIFNMIYRRTDGNIGWVDPNSKVKPLSA